MSYITTGAILRELDNLIKDPYEDLFWQGTDRDYIYHGSNKEDESINGIEGEKAFFSDSRYDAMGYGNHIVKIKKNTLNIDYLPEDPLKDDIPANKDGIGYPKGLCNNYIIYTSAANNRLEQD